MVEPNKPRWLIVEPPEGLAGQREKAIEQLNSLGWRIIADNAPLSVKAATHRVTHSDQSPTSLIHEVATGEVVEALVHNDFRRAALVKYGTKHVGGALANQLLGMESGMYGRIPRSVPKDYYLFYTPHRTKLAALRAEAVEPLYTDIVNGKIDKAEVLLSVRQKSLLEYMLNLIHLSKQ